MKASIWAIDAATGDLVCVEERAEFDIPTMAFYQARDDGTHEHKEERQMAKPGVIAKARCDASDWLELDGPEGYGITADTTDEELKAIQRRIEEEATSHGLYLLRTEALLNKWRRNLRNLAVKDGLLAVVEEFVADLKAVGAPHVVDSWPDLEITYAHAVKALKMVKKYREEGTPSA